MLQPAPVLPTLPGEIDSHDHHLLDDVITGGTLKFERGGIAVLPRPGLGVEVDPDKLAKHHQLSTTQMIGSWIEDPKSPNMITYCPNG
jgi:glucarate dehydratase